MHGYERRRTANRLDRLGSGGLGKRIRDRLNCRRAALVADDYDARCRLPRPTLEPRRAMEQTLDAVDDQRTLIANRADHALDAKQPVPVARDDLAEPRRQLLPIHRPNFLNEPGADRLIMRLFAAKAGVDASRSMQQLRAICVEVQPTTDVGDRILYHKGQRLRAWRR